MDTSKGEQREILLGAVTGFCRFLKVALCRKSLISTKRNDLLKPGKLLNIILHMGDKTRQFSFFSIITLIFREQDFFKRGALLLNHPVESCNLCWWFANSNMISLRHYYF